MKESICSIIADGLDAFTDGRGFSGKHKRAVDMANAAPDLLAALELCVRYLADLNGSSWINGDDPGSVDMRQRAKCLQDLAFKAATKAKG